MGALLGCCFKSGFQDLSLTGSHKTNRRQTLQALLSNRDDPSVDGRKYSGPPPENRRPSSFSNQSKSSPPPGTTGKSFTFTSSSSPCGEDSRDKSATSRAGVGHMGMARCASPGPPGSRDKAHSRTQSSLGDAWSRNKATN